MKFTVLSAILVIFFVIVRAQEHPPLCTQGGCCDIANGLFKVAGTPCAESKHPCLEPSSLCTGFSEKCDKKAKPDGTICYGAGKCLRGVCMSEDGMPIEQPSKSADISSNMAALPIKQQPATPTPTPAAPATPATPTTPATPAAPAQPADAKKPEEKKPEDDKNTVIIHHFHDPIAESLQHIPTLAARRARRKAIEDRKVSVFRKLTHFVLRKHKEKLEENEIFVRHGKKKLMEEQHDLKNLHRHLHLHHKQNHGLDKYQVPNNTISVMESVNSLRSSLSVGDGSTNDYTPYIIVGTLGFVAVMLIIYIIGAAVKGKKSQTAVQKKKAASQKDYF